MNYKKLKKSRVYVSLVFFLSIIILFLDIYRFLPAEVYSIVLKLQFIPSILEFFTAKNFGVNIEFAGFFIILILTILFGRVYCSSICPLGILMDFTTRLRNKFWKRKKFAFKKPTLVLRYSILFLTIIFWISGIISFVTLFDPFSIFGRITNTLFLSMLVFVNNSLTSLLELFNIYYLININHSNATWFVIALSSTYFITILIFSVFYGRQYCNMICPVGTFLGLFSKFSLFKINFDKEKCNLCGACEKVCKAYCIESENMSIDFERCVSCFNCLIVCPETGLHYKSVFHKNKTAFSKERREIIVKTSALTITFIGLNSCSNKISKQDAEQLNKSQFPVIPPGAKSIEHFNNTCTACYTCVSACPTKVLQPTFIDFGLKGILQPKMDYWKSYCNYDCIKCTEVCPSKALLPLNLEQKHLEQIGIAKFVKKDCVVETEKKDCGACAEHCPTKAVQMIPYGELAIPEVTEEICIGCGACEFACPTKPKKAIYVESNVTHKKAQTPKKEKKKLLQTEEFPF